MSRLNREDILGALQELAHELEEENANVELFVVGGAALVLLYGARTSTRDIDAFTTDDSVRPQLRAAAARVAASRGLPEDWLNDAAKGYVHALAPGPVVFEESALRVRALAPHQLLAMKLSAWRDDVDIDDARLLLRTLAETREAAWQLVVRHLVPGRELKVCI